MSLFSDSMSFSNTAFGEIAGETVEIVAGGDAASFEAISVEDAEMSQIANPGGRLDDVTTFLTALKTAVESAGLKEGTVLRIRGRLARINKINDDGDNTLFLTCGPAGIRL